MTEKSRVISLLSSFAGLLLAVGSMTVFSACGPRDDGTWMNCHNAQNYVALCGAGLAVLKPFARIMSSVIAILALWGILCVAAREKEGGQEKP